MDHNSKLLRFGNQVEGYRIPVLNEREIRAAAGLLFLATFLSLMFIVFRGNFVPVKYVITLFLTDFLIRVFINPEYSPSLVLGRLIVRNQRPEYVGAAQKKFAWKIGLVVSGIMFIFLVLLNTYSPVTGIGCLVCLVFLFFEAAFGICLGCKFYKLVYREKAQYCPGEICDKKSGEAIQKTSVAQLLVVLAFAGYVIGAALLFSREFKKQPADLFGINEPGKKQKSMDAGLDVP